MKCYAVHSPECWPGIREPSMLQWCRDHFWPFSRRALLSRFREPLAVNDAKLISRALRDARLEWYQTVLVRARRVEDGVPFDPSYRDGSSPLSAGFRWITRTPVRALLPNWANKVAAFRLSGMPPASLHKYEDFLAMLNTLPPDDIAIGALILTSGIASDVHYVVHIHGRTARILLADPLKLALADGEKCGDHDLSL